MTLRVDLAGLSVGLDPTGALWWPDQQGLVVADVHFGKAASFRLHGVPVPRGTTGQTLQQLTERVAFYGARQIFFLGDFLHSARGRAPATLRALLNWRHAHPDRALTLVRGNHDHRAGDPPSELGMTVVNEPLHLGPLALCHHPAATPGAYVLAGHWHPCVSLQGHARDRLRLPCFWLGAEVGILPAFGSFTGMHPISPRPGDRVYAVAGDVVRPLGTR